MKLPRSQCVKDLPFEQLVLRLAIEAFTVALLPG
jgi:hypothetical protein